MPIVTQRLPGEPIIIAHMLPPVDMLKEPPALNVQVVELKKEIGGRVYRIMDFTQYPITFSDLILGMAADTSNEGGANDPEVTSVFAGSSELVKFGVKAFEQKQYGVANLPKLFTSVEDALVYLREQIAGK